MYTVDLTFSYRCRNFICTSLKSSAHAHGTEVRGRNFNSLKLPQDLQGNGRFATDSEGHLRTSNGNPRTGMFPQTRCERGISDTNGSKHSRLYIRLDCISVIYESLHSSLYVRPKTVQVLCMTEFLHSRLYVRLDCMSVMNESVHSGFATSRLCTKLDCICDIYI